MAFGAPPLTLDEWCRTIGTVGVLDPYAELEARIGPYDVEALRELRRARNRELLEGRVALPGVERWLDEARAAGVLVAVASSSPRAWVEGHLVRLGLVDRFGCLSCFGDGLQAKPAPDLYLAACAALEVDPSQALAVEDSPNGIAAAKAAGLACVAVPNEMTAHLPLTAADLVVASLAELPLADAAAALGWRLPGLPS